MNDTLNLILTYLMGMAVVLVVCVMMAAIFWLLIRLCDKYLGNNVTYYLLIFAVLVLWFFMFPVYDIGMQTINLFLGAK